MQQSDVVEILKDLRKRMNLVHADRRGSDAQALLALSVAAIALVVLRERL